MFKPEAIMLCAAKVSAVSGDARRALEISFTTFSEDLLDHQYICRRALTIAEGEYRNDVCYLRSFVFYLFFYFFLVLIIIAAS